MLKLDFKKAFDMVELTTILQMLDAKGFPPRWRSWIKDILSTGSSSVLVNGIPRIDFQCKRGVREGDPLSPSFLS